MLDSFVRHCIKITYYVYKFLRVKIVVLIFGGS
jgi:hypothetical protein